MQWQGLIHARQHIWKKQVVAFFPQLCTLVCPSNRHPWTPQTLHCAVHRSINPLASLSFFYSHPPHLFISFYPSPHPLSISPPSLASPPPTRFVYRSFHPPAYRATVATVCQLNIRVIIFAFIVQRIECKYLYPLLSSISISPMSRYISLTGLPFFLSPQNLYPAVHCILPLGPP